MIPVQEVFYLRQLWVNIFCIHNVKTNNEACSFLKDYIEALPPIVTKLPLFSDHTVVRFLMSFYDSGRFKLIRHHFPVCGRFCPVTVTLGASNVAQEKLIGSTLLSSMGNSFFERSARDGLLFIMYELNISSLSETGGPAFTKNGRS
ncbi:hypothetical protein HHI36_004300 [Cryptolaemus montrouzieri]|uniref:Uncharacterized protein n=1 Tax=Cryptolaemus montrouzieri TaxID=559131 RepID=A0ABD2NQS6_9CUCU